MKINYKEKDEREKRRMDRGINDKGNQKMKTVNKKQWEQKYKEERTKRTKIRNRDVEKRNEDVK